MFDSVRGRLTAWYGGALGLVLVTFSILVYALLANSLERRTDASLHAAVDSMKNLLGYERAEGDSELEAARNTVAELRYPHMALAVYTADGKLLAESLAERNIHAALPMQPSLVRETVDLVPRTDQQNPGVEVARVAVQRVRALPSDAPNLIVALYSLETINEEMRSLRQVFLIAVPLAIVLAAVGGWFLARQALNPVVSMSEQAHRLGASNLSERLVVANPKDELGRLATTFNDLLGRLNLAFDQQHQFMADASHELRTPVSVIHTTAEVTLEGTSRSQDEYRDALLVIDKQAQRLARIVSEMFILARADAGHRPIETADFYLDEVTAETVHAAEILGRQRGVAIRMDPTGEVPFHGDEGLLRQMLFNLLDNSINHTTSGGSVTVGLVSQKGQVEMIVEDTGAGISLEAQPHIFERFYREDDARSKDGSANGGGAGLGLSIARWVAEAHGGSIKLVKSDSQGTAFSIILPNRGNASNPAMDPST
jgi:two-component system, OmpR family, sensor kinase